MAKRFIYYFLSIFCYIYTWSILWTYEFSKYKNRNGDLIDDVEGFVMHWSPVTSSYANSIKLVGRKELNMHCAVFMIDKNPKYCLEKRGDTDRFHGHNPYYGWNKLSHDILI